MINETINSIIEAENKAMEIEQNALEQARVILNAAELEIETLNTKAIEENKALSKQIMSQSEINADTKASLLLEKRKSEIDSSNAKYGKNIEKAVEFVIRSLK